MQNVDNTAEKRKLTSNFLKIIGNSEIISFQRANELVIGIRTEN